MSKLVTTFLYFNFDEQEKSVIDLLILKKSLIWNLIGLLYFNRVI